MNGRFIKNAGSSFLHLLFDYLHAVSGVGAEADRARTYFVVTVKKVMVAMVVQQAAAAWPRRRW